jgi:gluconate kinase
MIVLVMGVAGVGKTTIGEALARALAARFIDADDYHPPENVAKMKAGVPLRERMKARKHRYMPAALLDSQLATLEPPADAIAIDVAAALEDSVAASSSGFNHSPRLTGDHPMLRG